MRKWRIVTFGDPFHKQDRSIKSESKVLAAKRRKRDVTGQFNLEAKNTVVFNAKSGDADQEEDLAVDSPLEDESPVDSPVKVESLVASPVKVESLVAPFKVENTTCSKD